jgi:hypothetical protein
MKLREIGQNIFLKPNRGKINEYSPHSADNICVSYDDDELIMLPNIVESASLDLLNNRMQVKFKVGQQYYISLAKQSIAGIVQYNSIKNGNINGSNLCFKKIGSSFIVCEESTTNSNLNDISEFTVGSLYKTSQNNGWLYIGKFDNKDAFVNYNKATNTRFSMEVAFYNSKMPPFGNIGTVGGFKYQKLFSTIRVYPEFSYKSDLYLKQPYASNKSFVTFKKSIKSVIDVVDNFIDNDEIALLTKLYTKPIVNGNNINLDDYPELSIFNGNLYAKSYIR